MPDAALILPGDQPRVRPEVMLALIAAAGALADAGFVVPAYADDPAPNPVLACRRVWRLADELAGDHGFGPVLAAHPELVRRVPVPGSNPDVDTVADLERLRLAPTTIDGADVS
jgi:CTP:molybdopterin cytidylyltransferase MocA